MIAFQVCYNPQMSLPCMPNFFHILGRLKGLFGGSPSSEDDGAQDAENAPPRETKSTSTSSASASSSGVPESTKHKDKKPVSPVENTIPLGINILFTTIPPMTVEEKRAARSRSVLLSPYSVI